MCVVVDAVLGLVACDAVADVVERSSVSNTESYIVPRRLRLM